VSLYGTADHGGRDDDEDDDNNNKGVKPLKHKRIQHYCNFIVPRFFREQQCALGLLIPKVILPANLIRRIEHRDEPAAGLFLESK